MAVALVQHPGNQGIANSNSSTGTTQSTTATFGPSGGTPLTSNICLLFACGYCYQGASISLGTPSGWTLAGSHTISATSNNFYPTIASLYWRTGFTATTQAIVATVGASGVYRSLSATMLELSGASTTAPIDPNSGFLATDGSYTATGTATGPNLAASIANTLGLAFFFCNDDYDGLIGARSGWTEIGYSQAIGSSPAMEIQSYGTTPTVGTNVQTSVTIANVDASPVTFNAFEVFISPPAAGGIPPSSPDVYGGFEILNGGVTQ